MSSIRTTMIDAVADITPATMAHVKFRAHDQRSMSGMDFQLWCEKNPTAALRRFSLVDDGTRAPSGASNTDVDWVEVEYELLVAYPRDHRYGAQLKLDAFDVMDSDTNQLTSTVGYRAFATLAAADATVMEPERVRRVDGDACFFTVITIRVGYWRAQP